MEIDTTKNNDVYDKVDIKFIQAVDKIIELNKEIGIKPNNDSSIGKLIYPSNRSIISSVRGRSKHIPHMALINLSKQFNLDMNFFYQDECELKYKPQISEKFSVKGNGILNKGDNNVTIHAGNGNIKGINTAKKGSSNTVMAVDTMITNFTSKLDKQYADQFFVILGEIQTENNKVLKKLENLLNEKTLEMKTLANEHKNDTLSLREEVRKANERAFKAQENENEILKKYLTELNSKR